MTENKTKPTKVSVDEFLSGVSDNRKKEAHTLIAMMRDISGEEPVMWGPSIIGFGSQHYKYDTGREGDMPRLAFSPRKASITVYFAEGFDNHYAGQLAKLGKHKSSVGCLYINKLSDIDSEVLKNMISESYALGSDAQNKPTTVDEYIEQVPSMARPKFNELRQLVQAVLPQAQEVLSYGIVGYKIDDKRARVYISGWKDHVAMYPLPKSEALQVKLKPYIKGKGTAWFSLDKDLPTDIIREAVKELTK